MEEKKEASRWLILSILSLLVVALLGCLMRYKIGFEFPYFDQKNIQHAHSHFAFAGWVSQTLMVLMVYQLSRFVMRNVFDNYRLVLWANLVASYGMLISFSIQGYGAVSIALSTLSIFISWLFAYAFFQDLKRLPGDNPSKSWFKAALVFNVISSIGTFFLAWMMATHNLMQHYYLASIYYYLHFQYNGWFFFACMGIFIGQMHLHRPDIQVPSSVFRLFVVSCVCTYFLSTLWANLPAWVYWPTVLAAFLQVWAWADFLRHMAKNRSWFSAGIKPVWQFIYVLLALALSAKFLLQLGSVIPEVSKLAFGFRPIVIAYLHLVLLAITSVFLLGFVFSTGLLVERKWTTNGLLVFISGAYLNEIVLGIQGVASFSYTPIPFANQILFGLAVLMVAGLSVVLSSLRQNKA